MKIYKGYQIKPHKEFGSMSIVVTDGKGGKIPDVLSGMFTSVGLAVNVIDQYLETKKKDTTNAEKIS